MSKIWEVIKGYTPKVLDLLVVVWIVYWLFFMPPLHKDNPALKDYKDGVQNHLTWSIKGECFFVRPNDDVTVYLVRVPDCDKK